jgi:DNA-binding winged helix-turn-helix (wHTH) protein
MAGLEWLQVGDGPGEIRGKFGGSRVIARFGLFELDSEQRLLTRGSDVLHVTPKAFELLGLLIAEAPRVLTKKELHERRWPDTFVSEATLVSLVKELRRTLGDHDLRAPIIRTAHGVGYALAAPVGRSAARESGVSRWIVAGGRRIPLQVGENIVGRDPASAIYLDVAGVSRRHARIVVNDGDALVEDLGSKNGTAIGDDPLAGPRRLHDGDQLHIGPVIVIYHASSSGISTETAHQAIRRAPTRAPRSS